MDILHTFSLESNNQIKINFDGGDLSSDAGLLLFKEFLFKIGAVKLINRMFKTNDTVGLRIHKDDANLMQVIYQIISSCFEDDCADELTNEPVLTAILDKNAPASQPTLSRFWNRMDKDTLEQLNQITREFRKVIYSIKKPEFMLFDIDSTLLDTGGHQEGEGFNFKLCSSCPYKKEFYETLENIQNLHPQLAWQLPSHEENCQLISWFI